MTARAGPGDVYAYSATRPVFPLPDSLTQGVAPAPRPPISLGRPPAARALKDLPADKGR